MPGKDVDRHVAVHKAARELARLEGETVEGDEWERLPLPPLAAIKGAFILQAEAWVMLDGNVAKAREAGHSWQEIGESLGHPAATAAEDAYRALVIDRERHSVWDCPACGQQVFDAGPGMRPSDGESGHAPECTRLAELVAAWEAHRQ